MKKNYCDSDGRCTAIITQDEINCKFYEQCTCDCCYIYIGNADSLVNCKYSISDPECTNKHARKEAGAK